MVANSSPRRMHSSRKVAHFEIATRSAAVGKASLDAIANGGAPLVPSRYSSTLFRIGSSSDVAKSLLHCSAAALSGGVCTGVVQLNGIVALPGNIGCILLPLMFLTFRDSCLAAVGAVGSHMAYPVTAGHRPQQIA